MYDMEFVATASLGEAPGKYIRYKTGWGENKSFLVKLLHSLVQRRKMRINLNNQGEILLVSLVTPISR